jgi:hypothetical protein
MATTIGDQILDVAAQRQGIRYRMPPDPSGTSSLDCSLFIVLTFRDAGVGIPGGARTAEQIRQACRPIDRSEMQAGDLLFFENTYQAAGPAGPDGKIATHVGIAVDGTGQQMWDCHASNENTDLPGVGITNITPFYWSPKLFDVRRAPGVADSDGSGEMPRIPLSDASGPTFRVTSAGLRLRAAPSTSAQILIADLGAGSTVTAVDDQLVTQDDNEWRHVRAANGTVGWAADSFLQQIGGGPATPPPPPPPAPKRFRITAAALRLRDQPSLSSNTFTTLPKDTVVTEVDDNKVNADGIEWHHVRAEDGTVGWMSRQYLERVR